MKYTHPGYDLIGDLHGYADPLKRLLDRLGYTPDATDIHRHPGGRQAVFVGDFIDRGPAIRETLAIVRGMVEAGSALAVMGNHEFNALGYHTRGAGGEWLRPRGGNNLANHQETLLAFGDHPAEWQEHLAWFLTLPLWLELPDGGPRVVHACWGAESMAALPADARLTPALLEAACRKGTPEHRAVEILLKGMECQLPGGYQFSDGRDFTRHDIRVRWWLDGTGKTYRELVFPDCDTVPDFSVPAEHAAALRAYPADAPPVSSGTIGYRCRRTAARGPWRRTSLASTIPWPRAARWWPIVGTPTRAPNLIRQGLRCAPSAPPRAVLR